MNDAPDQAKVREPRRPVRPSRLRRRLTVAFVLVAGLSAGALAAGSFFLVRQARLNDSLDRAGAEATFDLRLAANLREDATGLQAFVERYRRERSVHAVLLAGDRGFFSTPSVTPEIPADLRDQVRGGELAYRRADYAGTPYLVVGGRPPGSQAELYFLFDETRIEKDLRFLRDVLFLGWVAVVFLAGAVGRALARRTLEPVARASEAARAMAEGLLATRLPVESRDEFGAWAASFNEMAEALEAKIRALSEAQARERRFTADVAHELRTPLTALVGAASLLKEHLERMPPEVRRPAQLLVEDIRRLRRLVDDLMEISRLDAGRESVEPQPVDLPQLVAGTLRARGWESRVRLRSQEVTAVTDPRRVERIVANLVGNALEHGGPSVEVLVGATPEEAFVEVTDDGPGIPREHLPHLFERFYKADASRSGPGSGLGLAIAHENARLLGGDLEVWSEPGLGSRFRLVLPLHGGGAGGGDVTEPLPAGETAVTGTLHDDARSSSKGGGR